MRLWIVNGLAAFGLCLGLMGGWAQAGGAWVEEVDGEVVWRGRDRLPSHCDKRQYPDECAVINQILVYKHDFVGGEYDCRHFSEDFVVEARKLGYAARMIKFGCNFKLAHQIGTFFTDKVLLPPHQLSRQSLTHDVRR